MQLAYMHTVSVATNILNARHEIEKKIHDKSCLYFQTLNCIVKCNKLLSKYTAIFHITFHSPYIHLLI